jgi:N-acetylglucosaminyldiphosphoundecaprenol N-acetyl-beta-D-mannosaminyltransferase
MSASATRQARIHSLEWIAGSKVPVGPMSVTCLSLKDLTNRVLDHALSSPVTTHLVMPVNAQLFVMAERNEDFRKCVNNAEIVCADGFSIKLACNWLGSKNVERVPGVDLVTGLCEAGAEHGLRIYLLGGKPGSAEESADRLRSEFPRLTVSGIDCPPLGFEKDSTLLSVVLTRLTQAKPQIVFVALGAPKQELLMERYLRGVGVPVVMAVGGTFEMLSRRVKRAPRWIQTLGMEWLFRFIQEPRRLWKRYTVVNAQFLLICAGYVIRSLRSRNSTPFFR